MSQTRNMLNRRQSRMVEDWLQSNLSDLQKAKAGRDDAAKQATAAIGFAVTPQNIRAACTALGIGAVLANRRRPNRLKHRGVLAALADHVAMLSDSLGVPVPEIVADYRRQVAASEAQ